MVVDLTVVLLTWNRRYLVNHALYNLLKNKFPFKLVVIDNASTDGTREYLLEHKDEIDELILNKRNIGCVAFNDGIRKAEGNYVTLQADDNILQPNYLRKMYSVVKTVEKRMKIGWICSANMVAYPKKWYTKPMSFEEWSYHPEIRILRWNKRWLATTVTKTFRWGTIIYKEAKAVGSGGTIIPIKTLKKIGLFRTYGLRGLYDGEWNSRLRMYGYSAGYTLNASLIHVKEVYLRPKRHKEGKASLKPSAKQKAEMKRHFRENALYAKKGLPPPSVPKL